MAKCISCGEEFVSIGNQICMECHDFDNDPQQTVWVDIDDDEYDDEYDDESQEMEDHCETDEAYGFYDDNYGGEN